MFGFPPILDGNAGIKFTNNADSGFPKPGIREIFYSNRNGNWTDVGIWETASGRTGRTPGANDDVYIRHTITLSGNATLNNLIITLTGTLNGDSGGTCLPIVVNGSLLSYGTLNYGPNSTNLCGGAIDLRGVNNYIDKTKQTATHIRYSGPTSQPIIDANYSLLVVGGSSVCAGEKYLTCDLTIGRFDIVNINTTVPSWLNFKNFNFTCNGVFTTVNSGISIHSEGNQNLIFKGATNFTSGIYCLNAPTFEFQNGAIIGTGFNQPNWNTPYGLVNSYLGTGLIRFTTNSQTLSGGFVSLTLDNTIEIADNITLTVIYPTTQGAGTSLNLTGTINGLGANSRLTNGLNSVLRFSTATAATTAMTTGLFDFTTNANTIQYNGNYSATIPSYFTTFHSLTIGGTGTKTLGVNTTLNGNLNTSAGVLQLSTFDLTVLGTTTLGNASNYTLLKSGAGNILFVGNVNVGHNQISFNFSGGNPNVEFRGGITGLFVNNGFITGTGTFTFSTNSQTISIGSTNTYNCSILISGAITLTWSTFGVINSTINGNDINSRLLLATNSSIWFNTLASTNVMATGIFDYTTNANDVGFTGNYSYTIPSTYTTFTTLTIRGTGTKTLSTNTVINGNLRCGFINAALDGNLELSTFNLTVLGATSISMNGTNYGLTKSGAGNVIFTGLITLVNSNQNSINFSGGNPTVEVKNGISTNASSAATIISGTGQWTFSTNSQSISGGGGSFSLACPILISGNITLTLSTFTYTLTGLINGDNAGSTLRAGLSSPTLNYQNTTQPMATGVLDTSTNLNTFIYGAGNQDVKGNPTAGQFQQYRNLRFSGSGTTKTLQGNINVQNTYTVDAGVTVNLNGFTKTPP